MENQKTDDVVASPLQSGVMPVSSIGTSRPKLLTRWWLRTRTMKRAIQINKNEGIPACVEFYVPLWAWPLELLYTAIFGSTKFNR